jgi:hypothetical protein
MKTHMREENLSRLWADFSLSARRIEMRQYGNQHYVQNKDSSYFERRVSYMDKKDNKDSEDIAGRYYETEDYKRNDQLSSGLATTHEQVSDTYMEGQADAVIEDVVGVDISIPRKGYDE